MRKSFKKAVALVLTAALAFSTPIATNATKAAAEETAAEYVSQKVAETVVGTGWWNGAQQSTSKYYVASGQSVDIYVTNTAGNNAIMIEAASADGKYFDVNLQATADTDIWGELIASKSGTNGASFPSMGTVKYNLTRNGSELVLTGTNVLTGEELTNITFTLACPDDEVLGFYFMAQDGTFEVAPYCNPLEAEELVGTGWWNGAQQLSSNYYVASGQSVDIYVANTAGQNAIMIETSYNGLYFDMNFQGIADTDIWGALITEKPTTNNVAFPSLGSAKITLTRDGDYLNVLSTNLADGSQLCDMTFKLDCPQEEVLGFFFMGQDGTFLVGPTLNSIANFIGNAKAVVSAGAIEATVENVDEYDSLSVSVNGEVDEDAELVTSEDGKTVTYTYAPTASGTYEFAFAAAKSGYPDDVEKASIKVEVAENGTVVADEEMIADLKATKAAGAYSITFSKLIEDATYEVAVKEGDKNIAVEADNSVKFDNLTDGKEYTVTVTASKEGYVTKTATTTFKYVAEKIEDAGDDVKRTMINKTVGKTDLTSGFWSDFYTHKIEDGKKYTFVFENHGSGTNNWNNFVLAFANQADYGNDTRGANYVEYAVVRADNYGWFASDSGNVKNTTRSGKAITYTNSVTDAGAGSAESWTEWASIIKDSNVSLSVTRSGSVALVEATITSIADATKKIDWTATVDVAREDGTLVEPIYVGFTIDGSYLNMKYVDEQASDLKIEAPPVSDNKPTVRAKQMMIKSISAKAGAKKVTGEVNASKATVQVKVGKKAWKKATVSGKKFTLKTSKLKIGTKIKVKATAEGYTTAEKSMTVKGTMKLSAIKAKKGSKKITAKVSVKKATVKVKVGKAKYKKATVKGKKITFKVKKALKKGTKVKIKVTKKNYKTLTKSVKVK